MSDNKTNKNIHRININNKEIILIGTAHVSKESAELVSTVIDDEKPDTVSIELCEARYQSIHQKNKWLNMDIVKVIKEKKTLLLMINFLFESFQKKIAKKLNIKPGQDMITAIETAEKINAKIHLADRDIQITLSRTFRFMSLLEKINFVIQIIFSFGDTKKINKKTIEKMKQEDVLKILLDNMKKSYPVLQKILINERDQYLSQKIKTSPGSKIVAIVGAGHILGIKKYIYDNINLENLEIIPPKSKIIGILKWVIPIAIISGIIMGFFYGGTTVGKDMIVLWILTNGILSGIGAIIAMAHPATIIISILVAPLTSLNPLIAAGWVSGLVEVICRKPKVMDIENLSEDILSVAGFWKNKVTKILLVIILTNIGSTIGTFVAIPLMLKAIA